MLTPAPHYDRAAAWIEADRPAGEWYGQFRAEAAGLLRVAGPGVTDHGGAMPDGVDAFAR